MKDILQRQFQAVAWDLWMPYQCCVPMISLVLYRSCSGPPGFCMFILSFNYALLWIPSHGML